MRIKKREKLTFDVYAPVSKSLSLSLSLSTKAMPFGSFTEEKMKLFVAITDIMIGLFLFKKYFANIRRFF